MTTNKDRLNEGPPAFDPNVDPATLPTTDQLSWGTAFNGLLGVKGTAENKFGSALLRAPVTLTGIVVAANEAVLPTAGAIIAVTTTVGASPGFKVLIPDLGASPQQGACAVAYDTQYRPTLKFNTIDSITEAAVVQLQVPIEFIAMLQTQNP